MQAALGPSSPPPPSCSPPRELTLFHSPPIGGVSLTPQRGGGTSSAQRGWGAWERGEHQRSTMSSNVVVTLNTNSILPLLLHVRANRDFIHVSDDDKVVCVRTLQQFRVQGLGFSLVMATRSFACAPCKPHMVSSLGQQFRSVVLVSSFGEQFWLVVLVSSLGWQFRDQQNYATLRWQFPNQVLGFR